MKKIITLSLLVPAFFASSLSSTKAAHMAADKQFPHVYYNTKKFPNGLFDKTGRTLLSEAQLSRVLLSWDLNGVIFRKEYSITANMYQIAVTEKRGWVYTFKMLASFGKLWNYKRQLKKAHDPRGYVWDAMFKTLETSPQGEDFADLLRRFSQQANILDYNMVALLQELSTHGHTNAVLSNMGKGLAQVNVNFLNRQLEKGSLSPEKQAATRFAISFLTDPSRNVIASESNGWLHKPMRKSYEECLSVNGGHSSHSLTIFFDDKYSNIEAALADGLFDIAVYYNGSRDKECKQLRKFLNQLSHGKLVACS